MTVSFWFSGNFRKRFHAENLTLQNQSGKIETMY
jgi:hypothetical protein